MRFIAKSRRGFQIRKIIMMRILPAAVAFLALEGCVGNPKVPEENVEVSDRTPVLVPDYTGIVVPPNIAPLNFEIDMEGEEFLARAKGSDGKVLVESGPLIKWDPGEWRELLESSKGKRIDFEIYVRNADKWTRYDFADTVAEEEIDPYISYRLIEPSYVHFSGLSINRRNLTNFEEKTIWSNPAPCDERRGYCINCHVPANQYSDHRSMFHIRGSNGGTVVMTPDGIEKVDLKTDSTLSAGVYPSWHPTLDLIAFSTNETIQKFPSKGEQKVEVLDRASDIILYDVRNHEVRNVASAPDLLETYPSWSPDGTRLYYSVARYPEGVTPDNIDLNASKIRYDIVARDFNISSLTFSTPDTVVLASDKGMSALLPRVSPDGRYLLYCRAPFGTFHIWHKESDLFLKDLVTGEERSLTKANSSDTDSYHSWSSNGRWIVFSSRRDDGSYTRPYITYIDSEGKDSKAFVVPQENPDYYRQLMKSYNVPEFMAEDFVYDRSDILPVIRTSGKSVRYVE